VMVGIQQQLEPVGEPQLAEDGGEMVAHGGPTDIEALASSSGMRSRAMAPPRSRSSKMISGCVQAAETIEDAGCLAKGCCVAEGCLGTDRTGLMPSRESDPAPAQLTSGSIGASSYLSRPNLA